MFADVMIITYVWFLSLIMQLITAPVLLLKTKNLLADAGWGIARVVSWLLLALTIWFLANSHLPVNATWFVYLLIILGLGLSFIFCWRHQTDLLPLLKDRQAFIITEEILFALGLFGLSLIRGFNPAILDLEKFMDAGFMATYLRSPTLPAPDMWLTGKTINYYSFGHFMGSLMTRYWNLPISYSYNLLLGFVMGLGFSQSFSFVVNLIRGVIPPPTLLTNLTKKVVKKPIVKPPSKVPLIIAGTLGAFLVVVFGNTHTIWSLLAKGTWKGYWYADATRFIEFTIHEFPSYSFVVSDLHGHVWDFPVVLAFLTWYSMWLSVLFKNERRLHLVLLSVGIGIFLGVMTMTSMWDLMIYGLLLTVTAAVSFMIRPRLLRPLLISAGVAFVTLAVTVTQFFLHFVSISEGVALVKERTPIWQLFALWTNHWLMSLTAVVIALFVIFEALKQKNDEKLISTRVITVVALGLTAWLLILLPELIYMKDIYTGHPRANTMFKLTYQGFILMGLLGAWGLGYLWYAKPFRKIARIILTVFVSLTILAVTPFPYFSYRDYYGALKTYKGMDGWQWLAEQYPDDYNAILWLNQNISGQPTILESWGESYTTYDRVSAYTGLPTVIGWRVHEWLWRGGFDIAGERSGHVDTMYKNPLSPEARDLFSRYNVSYIFVGAKEREAYPDIDLNPIKQLGEVVFQSGNTFIVKRSSVNVSSF